MRALQQSGSVVLGPVSPGSSTYPTLQSGIDLSISANYSAGPANERPIATATTNIGDAVNLLSGSGIVKVRYFALRVKNGSARVFWTDAFGASAKDVSDLLVLHCPLIGTEMTALSIAGNASIEYQLAGDPA